MKGHKSMLLKEEAQVGNYTGKAKEMKKMLRRDLCGYLEIRNRLSFTSACRVVRQKGTMLQKKMRI